MFARTRPSQGADSDRTTRRQRDSHHWWCAGQGATEARQAAAEGASVVVADVLDDEGQAIAGEVGGSYHHLDVTSAADWRRVVDAIISDHGKIDGLVNNAGIFRREGLLDGTEDTFKLVVDVNQHGVYLGMAAVAP